MISFWLKLWSGAYLVYGSGFRNFVRRIVLIGQALSQSRLLAGIYDDPAKSVFSRLFSDRPEMIGILVWPYQCASWNAPERIKRLRNHCELVDRIGAPFNMRVTQCAILADLGFILEGMVVILDQPKWFLREGGLVLNIFVGRVRMYSLAFSFASDQIGLIAIIGAIQGRSLEGVTDEYRLLTKKANGMRPRDLLFEMFCMVCQYTQAHKILAVSNEDRHHLHPFFNGTQEKLSNYNEIWLEHGGICKDHSFFELEPVERRRETDDIPAKKRMLYKKRYDMLDEIRKRLIENLENIKSTPHYAAAEEFDL
jgi:uncharacterized protein VirK/YbjX